MEKGSFVFDTRLNTDYLQSLYEGDTEYAAVIFEQFLQSHPTHWQELEESMAKKDIKACKGNIHKMKASFSFVGLTWLTEKAQILEQYCTDNNDINAIITLVGNFKASIDESVPIIKQELQRMRE
jgi:HPt (histidine-containing phosphotransfer) domain-containing protein